MVNVVTEITTIFLDTHTSTQMHTKYLMQTIHLNIFNWNDALRMNTHAIEAK